MASKAERGPELCEIVVPGQPAGAGSKTAQPLGKPFKEKRDRHKRIVLIYRHSSKATQPWMQAVEERAADQDCPEGGYDGALWLDVAFYEVRPQAHFYSDKRLRPEAPAFPHATATHDIDKMRRAISDALTNAHLIVDDKRIVAGEAWKLYADQPPHRACAVIRLGRMLHQTAEDAQIPSPAPTDQEQLEVSP